MNYIESHDLRVDESGAAAAHVTIRLTDVSIRTARLFVGSVLAVAEAFSEESDDECILPETHYEPGGEAVEREIVILRPQTSGPCVHYGLDGCEVPGGDCPHLDNPDIVCPVRDACTIARDEILQTCENEPEQEPAPKQTRRGYWSWTDKERDAIADAGSPTVAVDLYRAAYPDVDRTDKSIKSQYGKIQSRRLKQRAAESVRRETPSSPDFVGDDVPVTQHEEEDLETAGDRWVGAHVRILEPRDLAGRCGEVIGQLPWPDMQVLVALDESSERVWISTDAVVRE